MPADAPVAQVVSGTLLADLLLEHKIVSSKTDFRRLASEGAIKDLKSGEAIKAFDEKAETDLDLKIGKHRFLKIRIK
jgi:hypothetical protein